MAAVNSDQYNSGAPIPGTGSSTMTLYGTYANVGALSAADTINMFTMPAGFTPLIGWLVGGDSDTGIETLELDIGISGDATKFLNSGVITGDTASPDEKITAGIRLPLQEDLMTVKPTELTADTDLIVTVTGAAATGAAAPVTVVMQGLFKDPRVVA